MSNRRQNSLIYNPYVRHHNLWHFLAWALRFYRDKREHTFPTEGFSYPNPKEELVQGQPWVQWLNHSTFLIHVGGKTYLTDPIWSERCSPVQFMGPKRLHPPPIPLAELPTIDVVLISHDHYDHLDEATIRSLMKLQSHLQWYVPKGVKKWFLKKGISQVEEADWWQQFSLSDGLTLTFVPAQHFSGRILGRSNETLWGGWVVENQEGKKFYFVGDTGYNPYDFKAIGQRFGMFDLSLVPIGAYRPRQFMRPIHINPDEAVKIHTEVGSKLSVAGHWRTFRLAEEEIMEPPYDLFLALQSESLPWETFRVLEPGQAINW